MSVKSRSLSILMASVVFALISLPDISVAQERLSGIMYNPELSHVKPRNSNSRDVQVILTLPFFEDFSDGKSPYPSALRWADNKVFINNTWSVSPPSAGVATLDALDENGILYPFASVTPSGGDTLTSHPIDLDYTIQDNIWLSFWYQPEGLGNVPEESDSLCLDFFNPYKGEWNNVWRVPGTNRHQFKQVMISIDNIEYLNKGFRFRFRNKISLISDYYNRGLRGNTDHWHIDYIRLDKNRSRNDTVLHDVAMVAPLSSLINNYEAMPWDQFRVAFLSEINTDLTFTYRNLSGNTLLTGRRFSIKNIWDSNADVIYYNGGNSNAEPGIEHVFSGPVENPFVQEARDSVLYETKAWVETFSNDIKINDTLVHRQVFSRYYARDDGTAEAGYGIEESSGSVALKFRAYVPDSLDAVGIWINSIPEGVENPIPFHIAVWKDNNGLPGDLIYYSAEEHTAKGNSRFYLFALENTVKINGDFYVGWIQEHSDYLNAGFDKNLPATGNMFYRLSGGGWEPSSFGNEGVVMIRPFVKRNIRTILEPPIVHKTELDIAVSPNPASNIITLSKSTEGVMFTGAELINSSGRIVFKQSGDNALLSLPDLPGGRYYIRIYTSDGSITTRRILIAR